MDLKVHYYYWLLPKVSKQTLRIMKLIAIILFACIQVSAKGYSQISLSETNAPLQKVFQKIQKQSGYDFVSNYETLRDAGNVTVNVRNVSLENALDACLKSKPLTYVIIGKTIVVQKKVKDYINTVNNAIALEPLPPPAIEIHGRVINKKGEPLQNASVIISGSKVGTTTDRDGYFTLSAPDNKNVELEISSVGYQTKKIKVTGQSEINVTLELEVTGLSDVVVVGYGTQKKSDLTGAITTIKSDDFTKGVNTSVDDLLSGKAAGVQVVQNSSEPGGGVSISIRGASSINAGTGPLFVIDGLPIDNSAAVSGSGTEVATRSPRNPLSSINPADIASIEVLKDASAAAIYGSRGANGVVIITTKKGRSGAMKVSYNGYAGMQNIAKKIDLLTPVQYQTVLNELIDEGAAPADSKVTSIANGGTDWQSQIFQSNAVVQSHNVSLTGGAGKSNYYMSFGYFDQDGIVKSSSFQRYSARINLQTHASDNFEIGLNLNTSYSINDYAPIGFGINGESGAIYTALNFDPSLPVRDSSGKYSLSSFLDMDNPLALINGINSLGNIYRTYGTIYGKYTILPGLSAKLNLGGDILNERKDSYTSSLTRHGAPQGGIASLLQGQKSNYLVEATLAYDKKFNQHQVNAVIGATTQRFITNNTNMGARQFPSDVTGTNNLGLGTQATYSLGSNKIANRLLSYLGRVNYQYLDKYLLTASFRIDGSSRFGVNNRFGYFPSLAAAWKINEENFMKNISGLSTLKLRGSWGQTGNQAIGDYAAITTFVGGATAILDDQAIPTTAPARLPNPDLKWETTEQTDIGLDFGFLNYRISGSIDYYNKKTFNMLLNLPVPTSTGFASKLSNVGSIRNTGWEFALNTRNIDNLFKWSSNIIISTMKNKVLSLGPIEQIVTGGAGQTSDIFLIKPGLPLFSFYGYKITGIWQKGDDYSSTSDKVQAGDIKYLNTNSDKTVNADDRVPLGSSFPKFTWSFGNTFRYNNFELNVFIEGNQGAKMLNNNLVDAYFPVQFRRNRFAEPYLNRWTEGNPSGKYPSFIHPTDQGGKLVNSYTVEDASYTRIKIVTLSYFFTPKNNFISKVSVYVTGENLLTFTNYVGYDPSVNPNGNVFQRIDFNAYPLARTFMAGVSIDF
jgi:TonB-linked SusC/RagA family outer membrane protein